MKFKKGRTIGIVVVLLVIVVVVFTMINKSGSSDDNQQPTVKAEKRNIVEKALAIGTIDPETEIHVKSKISGVVKKLFADAGEYVEEGEELLEIRPDPTPLELAEAKRNVEMEKIALENARHEYKRVSQLKEKGFTSAKDFEIAEKQFEQSKIRLEMAKERLALLEEGKINIAGTDIQSTIKAPATGYILERMINVGDPIVPLTSYQEGTVLFTLADMKQLLFK